jgi:hypothetical protein
LRRHLQAILRGYTLKMSIPHAAFMTAWRCLLLGRSGSIQII